MLEESLFGHSRILVHWVADHFEGYWQPFCEHVVFALLAPAVHKDDLLNHRHEPILLGLSKRLQCLRHHLFYKSTDGAFDVSNRGCAQLAELFIEGTEALRKVVFEPPEKSSDV